jgi:hypothetical protein
MARLHLGWLPSAAALAFALVWLTSPCAAQNQPPAPSFTERPMDRIPAGTAFTPATFDQSPPSGFNRLILFVEGRLGSGDVNAAGETVRRYAELFNLVYLANVEQAAGRYFLDRAAVGFSTKIRGKDTVITLDSEQRLGANLGFIGRNVFAGNEEALKDILQIARTPQAMLIHAPTRMLYQGAHRMMAVRFLIWVSPSDGNLWTMAYQLSPAADGSFTVVGDTFQVLKAGTIEDRVMNVKGDRFTLGIPAADAFAVVRLPQGTAVPFTNGLKQLAAAKRYDEASFAQLLREFDAAMAARRQ